MTPLDRVVAGRLTAAARAGERERAQLAAQLDTIGTWNAHVRERIRGALACPVCGQSPILVNGGPHCPRCGWRAAS